VLKKKLNPKLKVEPPTSILRVYISTYKSYIFVIIFALFLYHDILSLKKRTISLFVIGINW